MKKRSGEHTGRLFAELTEEVLQTQHIHFQRLDLQHRGEKKRGGSSSSLLCLRGVTVCVYQDAVQVGDADHVAHGLDALDEFPEVGHHVFPFDDLGVTREGGR